MGRRTCTLAGKCWQMYRSHSYHHDCKVNQGKKKKNPWNEIRGVSTAAEGDKSRITTHGLAGVELISVRFWWGISTSLNGALLNRAGICCPAPSPISLGFVQVELLFSHRHKGQVKPNAAAVPSPGPQALFHFKATRTRMLLCTAPRHPHSLSRHLMIGWFCFVI